MRYTMRLQMRSLTDPYDGRQRDDRRRRRLVVRRVQRPRDHDQQQPTRSAGRHHVSAARGPSQPGHRRPSAGTMWRPRQRRDVETGNGPRRSRAPCTRAAETVRRAGRIAFGGRAGKTTDRRLFDSIAHAHYTPQTARHVHNVLPTATTTAARRARGQGPR